MIAAYPLQWPEGWKRVFHSSYPAAMRKWIERTGKKDVKVCIVTKLDMKAA